uniref:Single-stranded DNA-binding protein, mitochondrial n=1 Tax=Populus alba TaxID=43335 RepID=A0A4U5PSL5_POPAL|nr:single-stranded DNA-binding protein, mitochondrial [Populus alba]
MLEMALRFPPKDGHPKHHVALDMLSLPKQVVFWLGLGRAGPNIALSASRWQTKRHMALGYLNPKSAGQRQLAFALLPLRLYRSLLSSNPNISQLSMPFCTSSTTTTTNNLSFREEESELDGSDTHSVPNSTTSSSPSSSTTTSEGSSGSRVIQDRPLENGLDVGVYKAILVGQVGQHPLQKKLRSGREITMFSMGTGGIRNNRRPLQNEDPREYANRCAVQWHRVSVYPERLGRVVMQNVVPGSILYVEGNLETKVFTDPITGLVRRIREIAVRQNGRLVFLGKGANDQQASSSELKGLGYY